MALAVNVQNGTNAGRRKPPAERHDPWTCDTCGRVNQGFVVRCLNPGCNQARP